MDHALSSKGIALSFFLTPVDKLASDSDRCFCQVAAYQGCVRDITGKDAGFAKVSYRSADGVMVTEELASAEQLEPFEKVVLLLGNCQRLDECMGDPGCKGPTGRTFDDFLFGGAPGSFAVVHLNLNPTG